MTDDKTRAYHHGDLRTQLLETVRGLLEEKGPDGFSITEASRKAGVSSAAPYKHFRDKTHIMQAVAEAGMERLRARMSHAVLSTPDAGLARVGAIGQAYIDFARAEPRTFKLMFSIAYAHESDDGEDKGMQTYQILVDTVADCLGQPPDAEETQERAYMLWTIVHGHSFIILDDNMPTDGPRMDETKMLHDAARRILGG